jgi:hypothetical protein
VHGLVVVQNLVYLYAASLEFLVTAILQVGLTKPSMLIVAIFGKDLPNVAPLYIFIAVSKGPWLRYILPASEGQFFQISKDMQPLPLNGTPPFSMLVSFFFTKVRFDLLTLAVHGFLNLLHMCSLKNFNGILLKFVFNIFTI